MRMVQKFKLLVKEAPAGFISDGDASYILIIILPGNFLAESFGIISRQLQLGKAFKLFKIHKFEIK